MSAIDQVTQHFRRGYRSIEVPEWDLTIWHYPLSVGVQLAIRTLTKDRKDNLHATVATVIVMSLDDKGERIFKDEDFDAMVEQADREVLTRISSKLLGLDDTLEAAEKKSEPTPT